MSELIIAIREYAGWLYAVLVLFALREVVAMWRSRRARQVALFGLERDAATGRTVRSLVTLFLLATIGIGVHIVSQVVAPALPRQASLRAGRDEVFVETPPTVDLPTDTPTPPSATATLRPPRIVTAPPDPTQAPIGASRALCRNPDVEILAPAVGATLEAGAQVVVTVRVEPSEGRRYWVEIGRGVAPAQWQVIGTARTDAVVGAVVATVPQGLEAGGYVIRLVLAEPSGEVTADNVCAVPVRIP